MSAESSNHPCPDNALNAGEGIECADEMVALVPEDFQRIGLNPSETRSAVIRRAASRTSKSLATRQLSDPNRATEEQLSRIALSTYRLLDPRQRDDDHSRAHVGRIRPAALLSIERIGFSGTPGRVPVAEPIREVAGKSPDQGDDVGGQVSSHWDEEIRARREFANEQSHGFRPIRSLASQIAWIRHAVQQPPFVLALIIVLLVTAMVLSFS